MKKHLPLIAVLVGIIAVVIWNRVANGRSQPPTPPVAFKGVIPGETFVTLRGNQPPIWNGGWSMQTLNGPIQIHGDPADPPDVGLCLSRRWVAMPATPTQPNGYRILHSAHGNAVRDVYITGKFKVAGVIVLGVEDAVLENVTVDASCGVAAWIESSVDAWGLETKFGIPGGTTHSGGIRLNCKAMNWRGGAVDDILFVGYVTDQQWYGTTTAGSGRARFRLHTMPQYSYQLPGGAWGTTDARPNGIEIYGAAVAEGSWQHQWLETRETSAQPFPANVTIDNGRWTNWTPLERTYGLGATYGVPVNPN